MALAGSEGEYLGIKRSLELVEKVREQARKNGKVENRSKAGKLALQLVEDQLAKIGIYFPIVQLGRDKRPDYEHPVVPAQWDLEEMSRQLQLQAVMLRKLPSDVKALNFEYEADDREDLWPELVPVSVCRDCVNHRQGRCALPGKFVDFAELGIESVGQKMDRCKERKVIKIRRVA